MAKRALCVGINNYPTAGDDLDGCVNDARAWAKLLVDHYGFPKSNVRLLLDKKATHRAITNGVKRLLAGARSGDVLVFTNSSHGTYIADTDGDEPSYDEALCPWDTEEHPLLDDELRRLFSDIPRGVRLTVILDSCHSGSGTRVAPRKGPPRRPRFLSPRRLHRPVINTRTARRRTPKVKESAMNEVLLAGCKDHQESGDGEFPEGFYGAMTYYALKAIEDANYRISYASLITKVNAAFRADGILDQTPQLEGKAANKRRQIFT